MTLHRYATLNALPMNWHPAEKERIIPDAYYLCKTNLDQRGEKPWSILLGSSIAYLLRHKSRPDGCPVYVSRITDPEAIGASDSIALKHNLQNQAGVRGLRSYTQRRILARLPDIAGDDGHGLEDLSSKRVHG